MWRRRAYERVIRIERWPNASAVGGELELLKDNLVTVSLKLTRAIWFLQKKQIGLRRIALRIMSI